MVKLSHQLNSTYEDQNLFNSKITHEISPIRAKTSKNVSAEKLLSDKKNTYNDLGYSFYYSVLTRLLYHYIVEVNYYPEDPEEHTNDTLKIPKNTC